jgi:hypothetical protein
MISLVGIVVGLAARQHLGRAELRVQAVEIVHPVGEGPVAAIAMRLA